MMEETTRELVNILITQNANFKDMMQFGINAILTILIVFLGAQLFTMRSFKKEELLRVKSDLENNVQNEVLPKMKNELKENIKSEIQNEVESLTSRINQLEKETQFLKDAIERNKQLSIYNNSDTIANIHELKGDLWTIRGVYSNSLDSYIRAGRMFNNIEKGSMDGILNKIEETIDKMVTVSTWQKSDLQEFLHGLSSKYNTTKESIEVKVKAK
jgi:C4-dicarboxylate-specific signal transduction histidine kinase